MGGVGWGGVGWGGVGGQICVDVGVVRCHFCSVVCLLLTQHSGTALKALHQALAQALGLRWQDG